MEKLTLIPIGGLANRINVITSAIEFCRTYNIKLKIIWFKDSGMGADFHTLFSLSDSSKNLNVEIIDAKWFHYIYDRPRKRNLWIPYIFQKILFKKRSYEKDIISLGNSFDEIQAMLARYNNVYLVHCSPFYKINLNDLILKDEIRKRIEEETSVFSGKKMIGIHVRRTDNVISIKNSPLELFIKEMDKEIEKDINTCFYIASDSLDEKRRLINRYKERIITSMEQPQRNTQKGIVDALIELCCLSKTEKIYGSAYSTFSVLAAQLGSIELKVLSLES